MAQPRPTFRRAVAHPLRLASLLAALLAPWLSPATPAARAQDVDTVAVEDDRLADRPVAEVEVKGLVRVSAQLVRNNIRVTAGQPYDANAVKEDVSTLYRLGQFATVNARATLRPDGTVGLVYVLEEQPIVKAVQVVGNKILTDQELKKKIPLFAGGPRDDFLLEQSVLAIKALYREKGNYLVEVTVDESRLKDTGILIFRIIEGPRVKIKEVEFVGNDTYDADRLYQQIKTRPAVPLFRKGNLDEELLVDDVASLDKYYKGQGFVDVRIDRRVQLSADSKEAKVTFLIEEGRRYRLRGVTVRGIGPGGPVPLRVLSGEQAAATLAIRPGDWFAELLVERSVKVLKDTYLLMGYVDATVETESLRVGEEPEVDLVLSIREGRRSIAGLVLVQGNFITRDKVVRRLVRIQPGRPLDGRELELSKIRVKATTLFNDVRITAQRPATGGEGEAGVAAAGPRPAGSTGPAGGADPAEGDPDEGDPDEQARIDRQVRDILVEVKEKNTGSVNFGVGVGTDSGVFGSVSLSQRNFDVADVPESFDEFVGGRAFRGAGQGFNVAASPGNEVSLYTISLSEPHLFESDISGRASGFYRDRFYESYKENRYGVGGSFGRRLGDLWSVSVDLNYEHVYLDDFSSGTAIEVYDDRGPSDLFSVGGRLVRTDTDNPMRPTRGSQLELAVSQYMDATNGEPFLITKAGLTTLFPLYEDYMGRTTVLKITNDIGWIDGDAPVYQKFYLGGRSFRGFEFRTISPKATGTIDAPTTPDPDDPIGGSWLFFAGAQVEQPVVGELLNAVAFVDSGTVTESITLGQYRVAVGVGLRIYIEQLGPAPLAFDFAIPLKDVEGDQTQVFSFSAELPF
jgi:outer membrane protein insertion porin family